MITSDSTAPLMINQGDSAIASEAKQSPFCQEIATPPGRTPAARNDSTPGVKRPGRQYLSKALCIFLAAASLLQACVAQPRSVGTHIPTPAPEYLSIPYVVLGAHGANASLEEELGYKFPVQLTYLSWGGYFNNGSFSVDAQSGRISLATWEFRQALSGPQDPYALKPLQAVIDGKHDAYLQRFAQDAREFNMPLFLRWGHEMNGDWYPWSGAANGGSATSEYGDPALPDGPERFVDAYRHIHDIFVDEGAANVLWVWCPNVVMQDELGAPWNAIANYYPGDAYVDWLCMDGYNWGASQGWSQWQTFEQVFADTYAQLQALHSSKPSMIGETASSELGGDKAAWITDALQTLRAAYPQVRVLVWFHLNKETDWRINSSPASLEAFRAALQSYDWGTAPWPGIGSSIESTEDGN